MASKGVNKVILVGNLGRDPEVRYLPKGDAVANIAIATSESWKDQQGQQQERTEWHRVVIFGKLAEIAGEYLRKGSQIYIEGQLKTNKWQDKETGADRYTTEIVVQGFNGVLQMLGGKSEGQGQQQAQPQQAQRAPQQPPGGYQQQAPQQQAPQQQPPQQMQDWSDDIPFAPIGLQYPALLSCI